MHQRALGNPGFAIGTAVAFGSGNNSKEKSMEPKQTITTAQRITKSCLVATVMVVIGMLCGFC